MTVHLLTVPWDSGRRGERMGRGPLHLLARGAPEALRMAGRDVRHVPVESAAPFPTEIGTAFELHRLLAARVAEAVRAGALPVVLSGNCNSAVGTVSGLQAANSGAPLGVVWLDGHGDCNTPDTFQGTFLDAMGLSTLTGRCWGALCATVPGFRAVPDARVVLVGAHGADPGALEVLAASGIARVRTADVLAAGAPTALDPALDALARAGAERVYLHLDVDVLDADWAPANGFALRGGLLPCHVRAVVDAVVRRFRVAAAAVASYDPTFNRDERVLDLVIDFLRQVAKERGVAPDGVP